MVWFLLQLSMIYTFLSFWFFILSTSAQSEERCEILLGPEITYGPPGLNLSYPVAMTIAHCAEVSAENWNIKLKRQTKDKWEVGTKTWRQCFSQQINFIFFSVWLISSSDWKHCQLLALNQYNTVMATFVNITFKKWFNTLLS